MTRLETNLVSVAFGMAVRWTSCEMLTGRDESQTASMTRIDLNIRALSSLPAAESGEVLVSGIRKVKNALFSEGREPLELFRWVLSPLLSIRWGQ